MLILDREMPSGFQERSSLKSRTPASKLKSPPNMNKLLMPQASPVKGLQNQSKQQILLSRSKADDGDKKLVSEGSQEYKKVPSVVDLVSEFTMVSNYTSSRPNSGEFEDPFQKPPRGEFIKLSNIVPAHQITVKMNSKQPNSLYKGSSRSLLLHNLHKSAHGKLP